VVVSADAFGIQDAARAFSSLMGSLAIESLRRVDGGHGHSSWRVATARGEFLVKIALRHPTREEVSAQLRAQALARDHGLPVPELVAAHPDPELIGAGFFIQRWICGHNAAEALAGPSPPNERVLGRALGDLVARMHSIVSPVFAEQIQDTGVSWSDLCGRRLAKLRARHEARRELLGDDLAPIVARCGELLERVASQVTAAFTHRDLYLPNLIIDDAANLSLIDFEHACYYDPLWDFVKLAWWVFRRWPALGHAALDAYRERAGWPPHADERIFLCQGIELVAATHYFAVTVPVPELAADARALLRRWLEVDPDRWYLGPGA
jgi:aminoglycoside phosphotransferase (APT) family kinase protein